MTVALVIVGLVGGFVAFAGLYVAVGYLVHWLCTPAASRSALRAYVSTWLGEWGATLRTWLMFASGVRKSGSWRAFRPDRGPPIALVHGYLMNRSSMLWIGRSLVRHGFANIVFLEPRPLLAPLEDQADWLAGEVRRLSAHAGGEAVVLVAHSQGGLLSRIAAERHPELPVARIVTIGSPHAGTFMARTARSPNGVQMRYQSTFLRALAPPVVPLTSIYSDLDNIVFPKETSRLGESIELHGLGHHALCFNEHVVDLIAERIRPQFPAISASESSPRVRPENRSTSLSPSSD